MTAFSCRLMGAGVAVLAFSAWAEEVVTGPGSLPAPPVTEVVVQESGWSVGGGEAAVVTREEWDCTVVDDGILAMPFSLPGNALTLTGSSLRYLGRVPGSLCESSVLLAVPRFACSAAVELPTGLTGGILHTVGNGVVKIGRGFSDGVETMLGF